MASTHKAVVTQEGKKIAVVSIPVPKPGPDQVLVKVHYAAVNPTDWKHVEYLVGPGRVVGCDSAGEVVEIGANVTNFKVGDRIGALLWGSRNETNAAFAQYAVAEAKLSFKVPDNVDLKAASTLGVAWITSVQAFHQSLKLPTPLHPAKKGEKAIPVLIWSGATSVGQIAIQLAKVAGLEVITTSSERNFEHLKKLGADHVFDYKDPKVVEKIHAVAPDLAHAFDTISEGDTVKLSSEALGPKGGKVSLLLAYDSSKLRKDVTFQTTLAYSSFGDAFEMRGNKFPASPEDRKVAEEFWPSLTPLLESKAIIPMPTKEFAGGLYGIQEAFTYMKEGKHSGEKLVVNVLQTA